MISIKNKRPEAEFKEFWSRIKFVTWLNSWLVPLRILCNVSRFKPARRSIETGFWLNYSLNSDSGIFKEIMISVGQLSVVL